nr:NADH dehydrogenase subunit 6 [Timanthes sp. f ZQH-2022]
MTMLLLPSIIITLFFNLTKHPLSMTILILIQTLLLSLSMSLLTKTFWMSYILFLVFLGGMLVLFLYITSLASNELFSTHPPHLFLLLMGCMIFSFTIIFFQDQILSNFFINNSDTHPVEMNHLLTMNTPHHLLVIKLYNTPTSTLTMILVIYLLLTLIAVVKITNIFKGPLRMK